MQKPRLEYLLRLQEATTMEFLQVRNLWLLEEALLLG